MPQLDPANFSPQVIWLFISFVFLYLVMARSALPKVASVLENRENRISDDLDEAEIMKRDAQEVEAAYDKSVADARAEATDILKSARAKLQGELDAKRLAADEGLMANISDAESAIAKAKADVMSEVEEMASGACSAIIARLTGVKAGDDEVRAAVRAEIGATTRSERD